MLIPFLQNLPLRSAEWLGNKTEEHRGWVFGYIAVVFFLLPSSSVTSARPILPYPALVEPGKR